MAPTAIEEKRRQPGTERLLLSDIGRGPSTPALIVGRLLGSATDREVDAGRGGVARGLQG